MSILRLQGAAERAAGIHYEVDNASEPLGSGGMGTVFPGVRIDSTGQQRPAAIKFLFDDLPSPVITRARREASIQIKNDNLVEMFGFIQVDQIDDNGKMVSRYHVASELLHGVMLFDLLRGVTTDRFGDSIGYAVELYQLMQKDRLKFALTIIKSVLSGIMALHDANFVHRDIDPSNIMITNDGKIKVIDFGIVKDLSEQSQQLSVAGQFLGKPAYAAPETVSGWVHDQNKTTDIYAIGILLYELVTGHLPFTGTSDEVIEMQKHVSLPVAEIKNADLAIVLKKATAKRQTARYQSAAEFRVDIEHIIAGTPITMTTVGEVRKVNKTTDIPQWLIWTMIGLVGVAAGIVLGFWV